LSDDGNKLHVSKKYFTADLEKGIENIRTEFREKHQLNDDQHVIFFAPGNEKNEVVFCAEHVRKGIKEFLLKYSSPTSLSPKALPKENFVTVISLQQGSAGEAAMNQFLRENEWPSQVIMVSDQDNEHLDAMCAADQGLITNGQMCSSAAACHLPVKGIFNMEMRHQWYNDLFNRYWIDMNILVNNPAIPELIGGEAWYGKIADSLAETYVRPDKRYESMATLDGHIAGAMSFEPLDRT